MDNMSWFRDMLAWIVWSLEIIWTWILICLRWCWNKVKVQPGQSNDGVKYEVISVSIKCYTQNKNKFL